MSGSNQITASVANLYTLSSYNAHPSALLVTGQQGQSTLHVQPYIVGQAVAFDRIMLPVFYTNTTNSSGTLTVAFFLGLYTQTSGTLSLLSSTSQSISVAVTNTQGAYTNYAGQRVLTLGSTNTISAGQYWIGLGSYTAAAGTAGTLSQLLLSQIANTFSGVFGAGSAATAQQTLGLGAYALQTVSPPSSIAFSQINGTNSNVLRPPAVYFQRSTY